MLSREREVVPAIFEWTATDSVARQNQRARHGVGSVGCRVGIKVFIEGLQVLRIEPTAEQS
jgi:hypothetical protein